MNDIIKFNQLNCSPYRLYGKWKYLELFHDLRKKMNEWNYWKREIVVTFTKILITDIDYQNAQENTSSYLQELIANVQKIFDKGIEDS